MKYKVISITGWFVVIFLLCQQSLFAQQVKNISLKEAIELSINNSKLLKINKAKIDEAIAMVKEANERRLPEAGISGSYLYLPVKPTINLKTGSGNENGGGPKVSQAIYGMANVSLPLFTGGKIRYGIESAKYLEQATRLDENADRGQVIMNTSEAFINLYKATIAVELVKENLQQANQRVKDFSSLEKNGLLARNDLLKAQLQASNIELALLDAESNLKLAGINMSLMLGLPEQTLLVADAASIQQNAIIKTIDEYEQLATQGRKDLAALLYRKKAAAVNVKSAKSDYYPGLAITGGYVAADIPKFLTITNAVNIGIGVKYNIASLWKTKSKIEQAKAQYQQLSANEDLMNDNIRMQINQAYQNYLVSQKKIEVYGKAVEQASENYRIIKNKYDNALATTTDLLDADIAQLQAKLNVSDAKADAVAAYKRLLLAAGILNNN